MEAVLTKHTERVAIRLDYREESQLIECYFGWKPGPFTRLLIRALAPLMLPLEQGSYNGRPLPGEPHRASWVIAGPLTIFALAGTGYRHRLLLAARLRRTAGLNLICPVPGGDGKRKATLKRRARRRGGLVTSPDPLAASGLAPAGEPGVGMELSERPLELLCMLQRQAEFPITIVPVAHTSNQLVRNAPPLTLSSRIGRLSPWSVVRKSTSAVRTARTGSLRNARPLVLGPWLEGACPDPRDVKAASEALRLELSNRMEAETRACAGPAREPVSEVRLKVLSDPVLASYMQEYAMRHGLSRAEVLGEAHGYIKEIASAYRIGVARWVCRVIDYLFDRFLEDIDIDREGVRFVSRCDSRSRIVLVCSHKSYVDPLLIGYALFRSGMTPPQQAAGHNFLFWPMGWILRHCGAFYIRRTFRGETLYREVFRAYVRYLLAENYTSAVYIEGTRSRDGRLAEPKTGYLGIIADALRIGVCPDVTLVPVYLGYDRVPEERSHVREMAGGRKTGESMRGFASLYRSVNTTLGRAYVRFGRPMSMRSLLEESDIKGVAGRLCEEIDRVTPVTARSVASASLLSTADSWVSVSVFEDSSSFLIEHCRRKGLPLSCGGGELERAVAWLCEEGHLVPERRGQEEGYRFNGEGRRFLEYSKNMILNHFLAEATGALALRRSGYGGPLERSKVGEDTGFLVDLFGRERAGCRDLDRREAVEAALGRPFERKEGAWSDGDGTRLAVLASLLESKLEGYLVAASALAEMSGGSSMSMDDFVGRCFEKGERLLSDGVIGREESLSKVTFKNAAKRFRDMGLLEQRPGEGGEDVLIKRCTEGQAAALAERIMAFTACRVTASGGAAS